MAHETLIELAAPAELTLAEWYEMPEDEPGELVDGRLEEEEAPDFVHEFLVALLAQLFTNWDGGSFTSTRAVSGSGRRGCL